MDLNALVKNCNPTIKKMNEMKKIITLVFMALMIISCKDKTNSKTKIEKAKLDSIQKVKKDSIEKVKARKDSIHKVKKDSTEKVNTEKDSINKVRRDSISKLQEPNDMFSKMVKKYEKSKSKYYRTKKLRKKYLGIKYEAPNSAGIIRNFGSPTTLIGTNNNLWIAYFPKGGVTVVLNKRTNKFVNICSGRYPSLKYDPTAKLSKLIGKRIEYHEYVSKVSSIKYGEVEKIGNSNCVSKDCVQYYPDGNFTTFSSVEIADDGDFVTLKKIAIGRVSNLDKF